jgi:hypothetical protein
MDHPMNIPVYFGGQFKPNCPRMIIGRSSTKFRFFMPIRNPRWPPLQEIN